jgi:hypothetical protein
MRSGVVFVGQDLDGELRIGRNLLHQPDQPCPADGLIGHEHGDIHPTGAGAVTADLADAASLDQSDESAAQIHLTRRREALAEELDVE